MRNLCLIHISSYSQVWHDVWVWSVHVHVCMCMGVCVCASMCMRCACAFAFVCMCIQITKSSAMPHPKWSVGSWYGALGANHFLCMCVDRCTYVAQASVHDYHTSLRPWLHPKRWWMVMATEAIKNPEWLRTCLQFTSTNTEGKKLI